MLEPIKAPGPKVSLDGQKKQTQPFLPLSVTGERRNSQMWYSRTGFEERKCSLLALERKPRTLEVPADQMLTQLTICPGGGGAPLT